MRDWHPKSPTFAANSFAEEMLALDLQEMTTFSSRALSALPVSPIELLTSAIFANFRYDGLVGFL